jgi:hypothetical protein
MWSDEDIEAAARVLWQSCLATASWDEDEVQQVVRDMLNAVTRWRPWSEMPELQVGDKVWAYSRAEGVSVLTYDHPIHEDFDGPDEDEPPQWWMDGEDVSGPEWQFTYWMPYRVPEPPTND